MKGSDRFELDLLRRRAYGPAADIDDDPDALRRLRELEQQTRSSSADGVRSGPSDVLRASPSTRDASWEATTPVETPAVSERVLRVEALPGEAPSGEALSGVALSGEALPGEALPGEALPGEALPGEAPSRNPWSDGRVVSRDFEAPPVGLDAVAAGPVASIGAPRHPIRSSPRLNAPALIWVGWIASLAAVAAVTAVVTFGLVRLAPVESSHGASQIAALEPDPTTTIPTGWFGVGASSAAYEFYGLTLFQTTTGFYGVGGDCFTVVLTADLPADEEAAQNGYSTSGPVYSGCRVGEFPATVSFAVDSGSPPELRERFPGAALQFVKVDDRIGVFLGSLPSD
ncbi:hypothetical protein [Microbacterium invictum]|uniref:Uncharacterized protein n=1 Tax=Microbacterium invictum TaxID=515415 RepID=A0ABZ0V9Z5_9MICO|nr:hypothetical protein [Microbacterium invictum]WQB70435.1 hypothetical protein T9R20_00310 [Microbacterium invictum]